MNESWKTTSKFDGRIYGRLCSDEEFTARIKHLKELKDLGEDIQYYRDKFGQVKVKRGSEWWLMSELSKVEKRFCVGGYDYEN